jgi:AbrB family looped-hinge helix DNA binding protein
MTTVLSQKGQIVIPGAVRTQLSLEPGDDFEIEIEDGDTIRLRRVSRKPNQGLVDHLRSCPYPFDIPDREKDLPREIELA